ncbi:MAG TPA: hypothetical protein VFX59_13985 [Polyangiales bacterium]|nr:hypothetical protein [Polyangiales bacterium]
MISSYRNLSSTLLLTALLSACGGDDAGGEDEDGAEAGATHAEALQALTVGACAIGSCHGTSAQGDLQLAAATNLRELLVGVKACEAPSLNLVEPGDPDKSWLWIKLTAEYGSGGKLKSESSWGASGNCATNPGVGFGNRMPDVSPPTWTQANLDIVESWIKGGAPGPL